MSTRYSLVPLSLRLSNDMHNGCNRDVSAGGMCVAKVQKYIKKQEKCLGIRHHQKRSTRRIKKSETKKQIKSREREKTLFYTATFFHRNINDDYYATSYIFYTGCNAYMMVVVSTGVVLLTLLQPKYTSSHHHHCRHHNYIVLLLPAPQLFTSTLQFTQPHRNNR